MAKRKNTKGRYITM